MQLDDSSLVLVVASKWWPLSARLAVALLRQGFIVAAASPREHPLRYVRGISRHLPYGGIRSAKLLKAAIEAVSPYLIIPCDDGAVWQLHSLHRSFPALRPLIERSLGPPESYPLLRGRVATLQLASDLGIRVPKTVTVNSEADLPAENSAYPMVLKVDGSNGGFGVEVVSSAAEAKQAFGRLVEPITRSKALKRLLVDSDPLPFWLREEQEKPAVSMQQFISGRPANAMLACWQGEVLALVMVEVLSAQGETGAATVVRIIKNAEVEQASRLLVRELNLNGFHGLDFMLASDTGAAYLIEFNPRPTQLGHLRLPEQGDLAGALWSAIHGKPAKVEEPIRSDVIAFFPQALQLNPDTPYLVQGHHDVPEDEPELQQALLRTSWPDRRLAARLYHSIWPRAEVREVRFPT